MDDIDRELLSSLQDDARLTYAELGRRVGATPPARPVWPRAAAADAETSAG